MCHIEMAIVFLQCELMVETYEDDLVEWYWNHQNENLTNWLCIERVLDPGEEGKKAIICDGLKKKRKIGARF